MSLASLAAAVALALAPQAPYAPSLAFADASHGWLGTRRAIFGTADGGRTWHRQAAVEGDALAAADVRHAWAISGQGTLLRTIDGRHWQNLGVRRLVAISFADARNGFALQRDGILLRTADGGSSWPAVRGAPRGQALCFADAAHGWLTRGGEVYRTADAGRRWMVTLLRRTSQGFPIPQVSCRDRDVWVVLHEGAGAGTEGYEIWRSLDGGRGWREVFATPWQRRLPDISNYSGPVAALGGRAAVLAGTCGPCYTASVVSTTDGGRTSSRETFRAGLAQALSFPDARHGWLLVGGVVRRVR